MAEARTVTVFGGTGFLGRRVVRRLLDHGFATRVATRHPDRVRTVFGERACTLEAVRADVNDEASTAAAVAGACAAVNAVSLYVEHGGQTFQAVHVEAAARVAGCAARAGVARLAHLSGIGADPASRSPYIRSRGAGEAAVRAAFAGATLVRPAVMFGPQDAFLVPLGRMLRRAPAFPLFGRGRTRLQPAYVEDVAEALVRALQAPGPPDICELGGPEILTYAALVRMLAEHVGSRAALVPVPFALWDAAAFAAEWLPHPPVTRNQIDLMRGDNVADPRLSGFGTLGIAPRPIGRLLPIILRRD